MQAKFLASNGFADVAQLVEQRIRNAKVASSIPAIGTTRCEKGNPRGLPFLLSGDVFGLLG
jgi:hypothetical protein